MPVKAIAKRKNTPVSVTTGSPDTSWYEAASDPGQRLSLIKKLCERIASEFKPEKVILFGSQADGSSTADSDIDLMVIMSYSGSPLHQAGEMLKQLKVWMPVDLIVRSAEDIEQRLGQGDRFIREILERGKVMYEAANQ